MPERLLRAHFVRRFLDNDLISPDADRHEVLATVSAALVVTGLFVTMLMGFKYLSQIAQSPARTAVPAIDDRFFLFGSSMAVMALAALAGWNALSLDARDIAILGPLPIARRTIVRAKLASVAIVAAGVAVALDAVRSVLYPVLLVGQLPISFARTGELVLAHTLVAGTAGAFGFLAVLAVRELLHAGLGTARFTRVSVPVHAGFTVAAIVCFLLLPGMSSNVARTWLVEPSASRWAIPPLWFVGLHEWLVGDVMINLPHGELPRFVAPTEERLAAVYRLSQPAFGGLGAVAILALAGVGTLGLPAYWWNNRRIDGSPPVAPGRRRSFVGLATALFVNRVIVRNPVAQAGFWFALRCVTRSLPHRMSMATAAAVAVATLVVGLPSGSGGVAARPIPLSAFVPQLIALSALALAFRHAIKLPADLRANWVFRVAWLGDGRHYIAGVRRCAIFALLVPAALFLLPVHALFLGLRLATVEALLATLTAAVLLQALLLGLGGLPFAASYAPSGTLKTRGPVYLFGGIVAVYSVASLERAALESGARTCTFIAVAIAIYAVLAFVAHRQRQGRGSVDVEEPQQENTQRLGLT